MNLHAIQRLNERLGQELGMVVSGTLPRFAWKHSTEIPMCEDRIGGRWMLTQWRRPSMSRDVWEKESGGRFPYPAAGCYHPYLETALPIGMEPTTDLTQKAIYQFDQQMSLTAQEQIRRINQDIEETQGYRVDEYGQYNRLSKEEDQSTDRKEWVDYVQNSDPNWGSPDAVPFPQFMGKKASEGFVGI